MVCKFNKGPSIDELFTVVSFGCGGDFLSIFSADEAVEVDPSDRIAVAVVENNTDDDDDDNDNDDDSDFG